MTSVVVIESVDDTGTQWIVSFDGMNPSSGLCVVTRDRGEALKLKALVDPLMDTIVRANNALFDVGDEMSDPDHTIGCHADTVPETYRRLAKGAAAAADVLAAAVCEMLEPTPK